MRVATFLISFALAGCTGISTFSNAPNAGQTSGSAQQAYFSAKPMRLFAAAAALCDGPGQTVVTPNNNEVRCESLPDPESAAAIILQFNGTVEALPLLIIAFAGRDTDQGYLVTADNYIRVPQRSGPAQLVRYNDPLTGEKLAELLSAAGGRPL